MKTMSKRVLAYLLATAMAIGLVIQTMALTANASNTVSTQRFTDVTPDAWYYEAVNAMAEAGIVNGVGNGKFEPNRPMTAGELATVLWNMMYGDWCKATELYQTFNNGYSYGNNDYSTNSYYGPKYGNWGTPVLNSQNHALSLLPTTWDGAVALMIYGDSHIDSTNANMPQSPIAIGNHITLDYGRFAGKLYNTSNYNKMQPTDLYYSRDMSGLAIVAMSKEYVTRGFAISELVNVLRATGNLESVYTASSAKNLYSTGASIPDWTDITNVYHDICSASDKNSFSMSSINKYRFHDYSWAWNYIDEPGNVQISGGYANTWFSADILLAYQAGIISGKDASGRCDVGASMTRAEVCQMLYNAGVTQLKPRDYLDGGTPLDFRFIRDNKVYACMPNASKVGRPYIYYCGDYNKNIAANGGRIYDVYDADVRSCVDIRQQEWPTHPEFWGN